MGCATGVGYRGDGPAVADDPEPPRSVTFDADRLDTPEPFSWATNDQLRTPDGVWVGGDGCIWAVDTAADSIVRYDPTMTGPDRWSHDGSPPEVEGPFDIKASGGAADGWLWFTNKNRTLDRSDPHDLTPRFQHASGHSPWFSGPRDWPTAWSRGADDHLLVGAVTHRPSRGPQAVPQPVDRLVCTYR
jgi:hypothetical protein